ncbi:hypothetical protein QJS10_CPB19g00067 [Acorus calamus]|uniref:adenylate kinase n=1 Tax=Acorus calamus TaxID=4465 RepID=A0AAV9CFM2_ACOCL|nr:hypothetical protein QJS10_CPB19g00067 [Acorus calamus]
MACLSNLSISVSRPNTTISQSPHTSRPINVSIATTSQSQRFKPCCSSSRSLRSDPQHSLGRKFISHRLITARSSATMESTMDVVPLKIMISGAPASGKGTQCEFIKSKYELVHIAAGDLLRAEIASGSENGKRAKEYMEKGELVPDEIVVMMVKDRLIQKDVQENGWLLDGYPRSVSQATALEELHIRPDLFILLDVSEEILVERVVGRRLDPVTGKIYHLKYSPPENEEIAARLTQRFDDTEEKVKLRLVTYHKNLESVLSIYNDVIVKVDGSLPKEEVFERIDAILSALCQKKLKTDSTSSFATGVAH